jgi:hypothetical protein
MSAIEHEQLVTGCGNPEGCQTVAGGRRGFWGRQPPSNGVADVMHPGRGTRLVTAEARSERGLPHAPALKTYWKPSGVMHPQRTSTAGTVPKWDIQVPVFPLSPLLFPTLTPPYPLATKRGGKGGLRWGKGPEHVTHPAADGVNEPGFAGAQQMRCAQACPTFQQFLDILSHLPTKLSSR